MSESAQITALEESREDGPEDVIEVDGAKVSREEILAAYRNKQSWEKSHKEKDQLIASLANRAFDALSRQAPTVTPPPAPAAPAVPDVDVSALVKKLPNPVEDPEGHAAGLAELIDAHGKRLVSQALARVEEARAQDRQQTSQQIEAKVRGQGEAQQIVQGNVKLVEDHLADNFPGLSAADRNRVFEEIGALRGPKYGEMVDTASGDRVIRFNAEAVKAAVKLAGIQPKVTRRPGTPAASRAADDSAVMEEPPANASASRKLAYLNSLPAAEMEARLLALPPTERKALFTELKQQQRREAYSTG